MIFKRTYPSGKVLRVTYIISGIYAFILLVNYIFEISDINLVYNTVYKKGYSYIRYIICYGALLFALGELVSYRSLLKKSQVVIFFALPTLFILSLIFDFFITSARLNWPFVTTALLYAYFFLVQSYVSVDPLTETGNRLSFNEFTDKLSQAETGESWAIVMIDMDHFKQINDTFGHQEGDNALGYMAEIIKSCVKKDDFVARYGGDEFVLATRVEKGTAENEINKLMNEIQIVINIFNERQICPFKLEISYGYDVYTADGTQSLARFLTHIDDLMYKNKNERRRLSDKKQEAAG
jgi:diguanylate cyclase (GGDEF)-like protein